MALNTVIYYAAMRGIDYLSEAVTVEAAAPAQTETKPSAAPAKEAPAAKKAEEEVDEDDLFGGVDEEELAAEKKRREDEKKHKKKVEEIQRSNMYDPPHHAPSLCSIPPLLAKFVNSKFRVALHESKISKPWQRIPRSCVFVTVNLLKQRGNIRRLISSL